jgi:hypothetical protein
MFMKIGTWLTSGDFDKQKERLAYDEIFHLYMLVEIDKMTIRIEKNARVEISNKKSLGQDNIYLNDIHEPTGNKLLYKFFNHSNMKLKKKDEFIRNNNDNKLLFMSHYKDYYKENYTNFRDLWGTKNYYYKKIIKSSHYIFYINSNMSTDNFNVILLKDNIFIIKRIDTNKGWAQNLNIDALNQYTSVKKTINIGKSNENEKIFTIE